MEKKREFWTIGEIIELEKTLQPYLGWKGGSNLNLSVDNINIGDLWLFLDINSKKIKIRALKKKLMKMFPKIELDVIKQDEPTPYFLSMRLSKGEENEEL